MGRWLRTSWFALVAWGCSPSHQTPARQPEAPTALTAAAPEAEDPAPEPDEAPASVRLELEPKRGGVALRMDAPLERIQGVAAGAVSGSLDVVPRDLSKTQGRIRVDLDALTLERHAPPSAPAVQSEVQNRHMRQWLETDPSAPPEFRERNRFAEFELAGLSDPRPRDLLSGEEFIQVNAWAVGSLSIHGRSQKKRLRVSALFKVEDRKPVAVRAVTLEPLSVSLAEHDVVPRDEFGRLASKGLADLADKVAPAAMIHVNFTAFAPNAGDLRALPEPGEVER